MYNDVRSLIRKYNKLNGNCAPNVNEQISTNYKFSFGYKFMSWVLYDTQSLFMGDSVY